MEWALGFAVKSRFERFSFVSELWVFIRLSLSLHWFSLVSSSMEVWMEYGRGRGFFFVWILASMVLEARTSN